MLIVGQTVLKAQLRQAAFLYYWFVCTMFTFLTLMIALMDLWIVRRRSLKERKQLLKETLGSMALDDEEDSDQRRRGE
ncbi:MAG: hypothetical protein JWR26_2222 [Pedosphaera sp.]|nr:hypothetical protein [Pedosphaera sp.]